jgi:hypothetical protein
MLFNDMKRVKGRLHLVDGYATVSGLEGMTERVRVEAKQIRTSKTLNICESGIS